MRYQAVSWIFFPIGFIITFYILYINNNGINLFFSLAINSFFLLFQLGVIYLFTWFRFRQRTNIFKSSFGLGDLLFLIMLIPLFSPINYIAFFLGSIVFSLIIYLILKTFKIYKKEKIPLAGFQSLFLTFVLITQFFFKFNLYNDFLIIDKLNLY